MSSAYRRLGAWALNTCSPSSFGSSGSAPVSGQGIAVLVNRKFAPDQTIWEVQVGRQLHVVVPLQHCGGPRNLDIVRVYIHCEDVGVAIHVRQKGQILDPS